MRFSAICFCLLAVVMWGSLCEADISPQSGDSFITATLGEPSNLITSLASDQSSHEVASQFYVSLIKYDKNINIVPHAAESYEVLDNGLRLRFVLRKGIYWQDGVELSMDDVEFTYHMMIDPKTPTAYASDFKAVTEFKKIDRYTCEIYYDKPFARSIVTWMSDIMPKHALAGQDLRNTSFSRNPLSCGPFIMKEWQPAAQIILDKNPAYFEGAPYLDGIVYRVIPDSSTMFLELKSGKLDSMSGLTPQQYLFQTQTESFTKEFSVYRSLAFTYTYMGYNLKSPLFSDKKVRQALAHAINKQDLIKGALMGQGEPTIGPYRPGMWMYNSQITEYPYSLEKATALLASAGWEKNEQGQLMKGTLPFSFTLLVNQGNEVRIKTAVIIQSQLKKLGIEVHIRTVEWASFLQQFVNPGFFDAVILAWSIPQDPDGYDVWHSSRRGGGLNFIDFANTEVDTLLEKARSTFDKATRKDLYYQFQEILHEEQPYCFLFVPYTITAIHKRFQGIDPAPAGIFHNFNQWWVPARDQRHRMLSQ